MYLLHFRPDGHQHLPSSVRSTRGRLPTDTNLAQLYQPYGRGERGWNIYPVIRKAEYHYFSLIGGNVFRRVIAKQVILTEVLADDVVAPVADCM